MRILLICCFAALALGAACSESGPTGPPANYVGTYKVTKRNGVAVPVAAYIRSDYTEYIMNGTLEVHADGTWQFSQLIRYVLPDKSFYDQDPPATDRGTYIVEDDHLRFDNPQPGGQPFVADITANGMTWIHGLMLTYDFQTLEFARQ